MAIRSKKIRTQDNALSPLLEDIEQTKSALANAYANFENALDPDLIDASIYQVNAMQKRYRFLLRKMKQLSPLN